MLPGVTSGAARDGRLAPRAVPVYNAVHTPVGPLALVLVGALAGPRQALSLLGALAERPR